MSGSNTIIATTTLAAGHTLVTGLVTHTISGVLPNDGTPTIFASLLDPYGAGVSLTNAGTVDTFGTATQYPIYSAPLQSIRYAQPVAVEMNGTLSYVVNTGSIIDATRLIVPPNGLLPATYNLYGIGLSALESNITNAAGALLYGSGDGAYITVSTLTNSGTIMGARGFGNRGIDLKGSGLTNENGARIAGGAYGVYASALSLTNGSVLQSQIVNDGLITASGFGGHGFGVQLGGGGLVNNTSGTIIGNGAAAHGAGVIVGDFGYVANSGTVAIAGTGVGAFILQGTLVNHGGGIVDGILGGATNALAEVINQGMITGGGVAIAAELDNGSLTNAAGATIAASGTVVKIGYAGASAMISNAGLVDASGAGGVGILLASGSIDNLAGGMVSGATAIEVTGTALQTIADAGTLAGSIAIEDATGTLDLSLTPGASIAGSVVLDPGTQNLLRLGSGAAATIAGIGSAIAGFTSIDFANGAHWMAAGDLAGLASGQTVRGFASGDTLVLDGFAATSHSYVSQVGLVLGDGATTATLGLVGAFTDASFLVADAGGNTVITACFAPGTRILGQTGPVAVEALRAGERVSTVTGRLAQILWIGHRRTNLARHPSPFDVMPVRIRAGAIADALPARDLVLSPDHAVFVDGRLIPVRHLVNGISVVQERREVITYWHVELDRHDVILAEGLACESYLDTGNRCAFENAPGAIAMTPDFARATWAAEGCAPIVTDPADPWLRALHTHLLARASVARCRVAARST